MITQEILKSTKTEKNSATPLDFVESCIKNQDRISLDILNQLTVLTNRYKTVFVSQKRMASLCGVSPRTIFSRIKTLVAQGLVVKEHRGTYDTCVYKLPAIFMDPIVRKRLGRWINALLFIPLSYLSINIHAENIKICGKDIIAKVDCCEPIYSYINNNISLSRSSNWYKESPSMRETDFLKMDQKEKKFLAHERKYFEIVGQGLTSDQWRRFIAMDEAVLGQAFVRLKRVVDAGQCLSNPFAYLCKIVSSLRTERNAKPIMPSASRAPERPVKVYVPKFLKREKLLEPLPENSPWNIPYPWTS